MTATAESHFRTHVGLSEADTALVMSLAICKSLHRGELLLQQGQVCRHKIFVIAGLLRNFAVAADGSEHILQFAPELGWTLDVESYDNQSPASVNIGAVENSEVLLWSRPDFDRLLSELPVLKQFSQQLISRNIYNSRQRILTALSATPKEKYDEFIRVYPTLLSRLPLHMIASYLGISLKTLTRLRNAQAHAR